MRSWEGTSGQPSKPDLKCPLLEKPAGTAAMAPQTASVHVPHRAPHRDRARVPHKTREREQEGTERGRRKEAILPDGPNYQYNMKL